jgi:hypothetical protein
VAQNCVTLLLPCSLFDDSAADQSPSTVNESHGRVLRTRHCPLLVNNSAMSRTFTSLPTRLNVRGNGIGHTLRVFTSISVFLLVTLCQSKLLSHATKQASLVGIKIDDCASSNLAVTMLEHVIGRETTPCDAGPFLPFSSKTIFSCLLPFLSMILALPFLYPLLSPLSKLVMPFFRLSNPFLFFCLSCRAPTRPSFSLHPNHFALQNTMTLTCLVTVTTDYVGSPPCTRLSFKTSILVLLA